VDPEPQEHPVPTEMPHASKLPGVPITSPARGPVPDEWRSPSRRLGLMRRVEIGVPTLLIVLALLVGAVMVPSGATVALLVTMAVVLGAGLLIDNLLQRRVRSWGYLERADDLLVRRGVLIRRLSVVPYGRMQFVDVNSGLAERAFGLATARLHTAAAASDARVPGLEASEAARLRDRLAALGEAKAAGL